MMTLIRGRRAFKAGQMYPVASVRVSSCLIFLQFQGILRADFIRCTHSFKEESNILFFFIPCLIGMLSHKIAEPFCVTL